MGLDARLSPGARIGRYIVLSCEAPGRAIAHDPELDRRVSLRLLDDDVRVERARALGRAPHANLVAVHDVGSTESGWYVATEHVPGVRLDGWLAVGGRHWRPIRQVFVAAASGLVELHASGIVHGAVGPDAILIGNDDRVRLDACFDVPDQDGARGEAFDRARLCVALVGALAGEVDAAGAVVREPTVGPRWLRGLATRGATAAAQPSDAALARALARDPGRMLVRVGLVAAVVVALVAGLLHWDARRARLCSTAAAELTGVWDEGLRDAVHRSFVATATPFAEDADRSVSRRLDEWAGQWADTWTESCKATLVHGEQTGDVHDARLMCLDRRRDEVAALVRVLVDADADVVREAVRAASALTPVRDCAGRAGHGPMQAPGPRAGEDTRALRRTLADVKALRDAGKYARGVELGHVAVAEAVALDEPALHAEALFLLGRLQGTAGDHDTAVETLRASVRRAWEAQHDHVALEAWLELAYIFGEKLARYPEAHRALRHAAATIERTEAGPEVRADLLRLEGIVLFAEGAYDEARRRHEQALAGFAGVIADDDPRLATLHNSLANDLNRLGRFEEALEHYRLALDLRERALGSTHPEVAAIHNNLGAGLYALGDHVGALEEFRSGYAIRVAAHGAVHPEVAESLNNLGATAYELGRHDEALRHLEQALRIRSQLQGADHPFIADSMVNIGVVLREIGRHEQALERFRSALALWEPRLGPDHPHVALAYQNIGRSLGELGRWDEALASHRRALAIRTAALGPDHADTIVSRDLVAAAERALARKTGRPK